MKLSAKELRIGNYFVNRHGELDIVTDKTFQLFRYPIMGGNYGVFAIKLTDEWLLRFGFELNYVGAVTKRFDLTTDDRFDFSFSTIGKEDCGLRFRGMYLNIIHVHSLQNLYFALTGKELELKQ